MVGGWWPKQYTHIHGGKEAVRLGRLWLPGILFFSERGSPCLRKATPCTVAGLGRRQGRLKLSRMGWAAG